MASNLLVRMIAFHRIAGIELSLSLIEDRSDLSIPQDIMLQSTHFSSPKRARQFMLGRIAAREALESLNCSSDFEIHNGPRGEPIWPEGITGSITHSSDLAVAAVGRHGATLRGVGIDAERRDRTISSGVIERITTPSELAWVRASESETNERALIVFSMKEGVFKALYPIHRRELSFNDATILLPGDGRIPAEDAELKVEVVRVEDGNVPIRETLSGTLIHHPDYIISLLIV